VAQRAVAIPALGWRLRVVLVPFDRFGSILGDENHRPSRTVAATGKMLRSRLHRLVHGPAACGTRFRSLSLVPQP
jgi:hypothetical protein